MNKKIVRVKRDTYAVLTGFAGEQLSEEIGGVLAVDDFDSGVLFIGTETAYPGDNAELVAEVSIADPTPGDSFRRITLKVGKQVFTGIIERENMPFGEVGWNDIWDGDIDPLTQVLDDEASDAICGIINEVFWQKA